MPEYSSKVTSDFVVEDSTCNRCMIVEVTFYVSTQQPGEPVVTEVVSRQLYVGGQRVTVQDLGEGVVLVVPPGKKMRIVSVNDIARD